MFVSKGKFCYVTFYFPDNVSARFFFFSNKWIDPLKSARNSGARVIRTPIRGRGYHDGVLQNPQNDPFYYLDSELELSGLEVVNGSDGYGDGQHSLVIGSEDGLIHWDIDSWKRRCFPSYELA